MLFFGLLVLKTPYFNQKSSKSLTSTKILFLNQLVQLKLEALILPQMNII